MTRESYNHARIEKPEIELELCTWDFCKTCIDFRIRHRMKLPELRNKEGYQTYFRYINPEHRIERKKVSVNQLI